MKKILIMGASSGIGLRVAEELASRGVMVGMAARHVEPMKALQNKYPDTVVYESIDITHIDAPELMGKLIEKMGGMDIYFHVSGIGYENLALDPQREVDIIATNSGGFARMICERPHRCGYECSRHKRYRTSLGIFGLEKMRADISCRARATSQCGKRRC